MAWLYLGFFLIGLFMVWDGSVDLKNGIRITTPSHVLHLSGAETAPYAVGLMLVGAVFGLISLVGLIAMLFKRDP